MKGNRNYTDIGLIFDEIFNAARDFSDEIHRNLNDFSENRWGACDENIDYYPNYSYPPMNMYMTADRSLIFEFALAGFEEKNISLVFQGDYMVFSATIGESAGNDENFRYFKRRLKLKDIDKQKYYVPVDKYDHERVKAVFRNGILRVIIPPKEDIGQNSGVKIEIVKEDD